MRLLREGRDKYDVRRTPLVVTPLEVEKDVALKIKLAPDPGGEPPAE